MSIPQIFLKGNKINLFENSGASNERVVVDVENNIVKINFLECSTIIISGDLSEYSIRLDGKITNSFILNKKVKIGSIYSANIDEEINLYFEGENQIYQTPSKTNILTIINGFTIIGSSKKQSHTQIRELTVQNGSSLELLNVNITYADSLTNDGKLNLNKSIIRNGSKNTLLNRKLISIQNDSIVYASDLSNESMIESSHSTIEVSSYLSTKQASSLIIESTCFSVDNFFSLGEFKSYDSKINIKTLNNPGVVEIKNNIALPDNINIFKVSKNFIAHKESLLSLENVKAEIYNVSRLDGIFSLSNTNLVICKLFMNCGILRINDKSIFQNLERFHNKGSIETDSSEVIIDDFVDSFDDSKTNHIILNNGAVFVVNKCNYLNTPISLHKDSKLEIKESDTTISDNNVLSIMGSRFISKALTNNGVVNLKKGVISSSGDILNKIHAKIVGHGDLLSTGDIYNEGHIINHDLTPLNVICQTFNSNGEIDTNQIMLNIAYAAKLSGVVISKIFGANIERKLTLNLKKCQIDKSYVKSSIIHIKSFVQLSGENNHIWHGVFDSGLGYKNIPTNFKTKFSLLNGPDYKEIKFSEIFKIESDAASKALTTYLDKPNKESSVMYALTKSISDHQYEIYAVTVLSLCISPCLLANNACRAAFAPVISRLGQTMNGLWGVVSLNNLKNGLSIFTSLKDKEPLDLELNQGLKDVCKSYLTNDKLKSYFENKQIPDNWLSFLHNEVPDFLCGKPQSSIMQLINTLYRYGSDMPRFMLELLKFVQQANNNNTNLRIDDKAVEVLGEYNKLNNPSLTPFFDATKNADTADNSNVGQDLVVDVNPFTQPQI